MINELFTPIKFTTNIYLKPHELNMDYDTIFLKKIKKNLEGLCSKHGYIKKGSIKIIKKSIGKIIKDHFNGNVLYNIQCIGEICNPINGLISKCIVKNKNSMGLLAEGYYDNDAILDIIVPKITATIKSELNLDEINIGDEIFIEICGVKLLLYDTKISIIGKVIKPKSNNINIIENNNIIDNEEEDDDEIPVIEDILLQTTDDIDDEEEIEEDEDEEDEDDDNDDDDDDIEIMEDEFEEEDFNIEELINDD
tara:strand:- start:484 stop:1239 length:756 start_codon:yes stop_codon:yes gene_type:complete